MKHFITIFIGLFSLWATTDAQIVKFSAAAPGVVAVGERFELVYTLSFSNSSSSASLGKSEVTELQLPSMAGFAVINRDPYTSQSSSTSITNGKLSSSKEIAYTYILQAVSAGKITLDAASCIVSGNKYTSNAVTIEVVQNGGQTGQNATSSGVTQSSQTPTAQGYAASGSGSDLYFRTVVDKKIAYQGEAITASVKIFSKVAISTLQGLTLPTFDGFFRQDVKIPVLTSLKRENVNGEIYGTGVLNEYVLFPQKSGEIQIGEAHMEVEVAQRVQTAPQSIWDDFFGSQTQYVAKQLVAPAVTIQVLPLPSAGKPASFDGAVGQFSLSSTIDKTSLKANEAVTLKIVLSGSGNFKLINTPKISLPPDFEVYDPTTNNNIQDNGIAGSKTFEYLMIPRHEGTYTIPSVTFSYFDPQTKTYQTKTTESYTLTVEKGEEQAGTALVTGLSREDVKFLGQDIHFIHTRQPEWMKRNVYFFGSWTFFALLVGLLVFFIVVLLICRSYIQKYADETFKKYRRAGKSANKRLKNARAALNSQNAERFYEDTSKALWGFVSDKLAIPMSELSRNTVEESLRDRSVSETLIQEFLSLIDLCEMARYAPQAAGADMKTVYKRASAFISEF